MKQIYYHFLPVEYAIKDLENKKIKVSLIDELNDPFELLPYMRYNDSRKRKLYDTTRKRISKEYGLLCFSGNWEEPLLWGHYADGHKGVAFGFEISNENFLHVTYSEKLRPKFDLIDDYQKNRDQFFDLAKIKYINWHYENEYRIIKKLDECDFDKNENMYFLKFGKEIKLKKVILGCNFKFNDRQKIFNALQEYGHEIDLIRARKNWGEYKISKDGRKLEELKNSAHKVN